MTTLELIVEKIRALPPEKQAEVLDFAEFVEARTRQQSPRRSAEGLCSDLGLDITAAHIAEVRREMWGNFPREDI